MDQNEYVKKLGELTLRCKDITDNEWDSLTFVFDTAEGHIANSGFLYNGDKIRPASAGIESEPLLLDNAIMDFRDLVAEKYGHKFKQLLIQMEKSTGRIKIEFEFDDPKRWTIVPSRIKEMREALRPQFDG